jgi:hypothetical protein
VTKSTYLRGIRPLAATHLSAINGVREPPKPLRRPIRDAINHRKRAVRRARAQFVAQGNDVEVEEPYGGGA